MKFEVLISRNRFDNKKECHSVIKQNMGGFPDTSKKMFLGHCMAMAGMVASHKLLSKTGNVHSTA